MLEQSGAHTQRGLLLLFILHLFPGPQSTLSHVSGIQKGKKKKIGIAVGELARKTAVAPRNRPFAHVRNKSTVSGISETCIGDSVETKGK